MSLLAIMWLHLHGIVNDTTLSVIGHSIHVLINIFLRTYSLEIRLRINLSIWWYHIISIHYLHVVIVDVLRVEISCLINLRMYLIWIIKPITLLGDESNTSNIHVISIFMIADLSILRSVCIIHMRIYILGNIMMKFLIWI